LVLDFFLSNYLENLLHKTNDSMKDLRGILFFVLMNTIIIPGQTQTSIKVDCDKAIYTMAGGIGASWHSISLDQEHIDISPEYKHAYRVRNSRGSAWGGNPPVDNTQAWEQIYSHAEWLGLSWLRVELSMRMYQPEKDNFEWDNEEMQALYKILDWAETNDADVFLQQMWSNVKWNSYPDVQPLISAPKSTEDFAEGLAMLVEYLINEKQYTCIKWLCLTNEPPGGTWGHWWSSTEHGRNTPITPALKAVRESLDKKNLNIPISGPDWTDLPPFDESKIDFNEYIGAYDIHSYHGLDAIKQKEVAKWAEWAQMHGKPLFLSEIGRQDLVVGLKNPESTKTGQVTSISESLANAEAILRGMDVGVGAFNRWSFTNRGDLDGQWQLIRTWNIEEKTYYKTIQPEPVSYYGYGIISRFVPKYSTIVFTNPINNPDILSQTLRTTRGDLTTIILNKSDQEQTIILSMKGIGDGTFYMYRAIQEEISQSDFEMNPVDELKLKNEEEMTLTLPPESIHTLTTIHLLNDESAKK
jgi:hypothetical protein